MTESVVLECACGVPGPGLVLAQACHVARCGNEPRRDPYGRLELLCRCSCHAGWAKA